MAGSQSSARWCMRTSPAHPVAGYEASAPVCPAVPEARAVESADCRRSDAVSCSSSSPPSGWGPRPSSSARGFDGSGAEWHEGTRPPISASEAMTRTVVEARRRTCTRIPLGRPVGSGPRRYRGAERSVNRAFGQRPDPVRGGEAPRGHEQPLQPAETPRIDQQAGATPALPHPSGPPARIPGQKLRLTRPLDRVPLREPQGPQGIALGGQAQRSETPGFTPPNDGFEIDAGGDVRRSGIAKDVRHYPVVPISVDLARGTARGAVVDEEGIASSKGRRELAHEPQCTSWDDRLLARSEGGPAFGHELRDGRVARHVDLDEALTAGVDPDLDHAVPRPPDPSKREVVHELVGDDHRCIGVDGIAEALDDSHRQLRERSASAGAPFHREVVDGGTATPIDE